MVHKIMPRKLRGFTLTEAAIVLGIVGLILGAIWVAASAVYNNMRVQTTTTQLLQMVQSIRSLHATQQTMGGSGDIASDLAKAGAVPKDMVGGTDDAMTVTNTWGGAVTIEPADSGAAFQIEYASVPREACTELVTRMTGPGRDSGLSEIGTADSTFVAADSDFPVSVIDAVAACTDASSNTLTFLFRLHG